MEHKVFFVEEGEYNPSGWYKPIVMEKSDLLFVCDERYTSCDNCEVEIDCDEQHIFCIYNGDPSNPDEEMTICDSCNPYIHFCV